MKISNAIFHVGDTLLSAARSRPSHKKTDTAIFHERSDKITNQQAGSCVFKYVTRTFAL